MRREVRVRSSAPMIQRSALSRTDDVIVLIVLRPAYCRHLNGLGDSGFRRFGDACPPSPWENDAQHQYARHQPPERQRPERMCRKQERSGGRSGGERMARSGHVPDGESVRYQRGLCHHDQHTAERRCDRHREDGRYGRRRGYRPPEIGMAVRNPDDACDGADGHGAGGRQRRGLEQKPPRGSAKKRAVTSATPPKSSDNATVAIVDSNDQNAKSRSSRTTAPSIGSANSATKLSIGPTAPPDRRPLSAQSGCRTITSGSRAGPHQTLSHSGSEGRSSSQQRPRRVGHGAHCLRGRDIVTAAIGARTPRATMSNQR